MILLTGVLVSGVLVGSGMAQSSVPASNRALAPSSSRYQPNRFSRRAKLFYGLDWGVDSLVVKSAESGEIIRFTYRVLDPQKAKELNDAKMSPYLIDEKAHIKLVVPSLENVGELRSKEKPKDGKSYWIAFSNKGGYVKPGHHVSVVIGKFRADGLVVQ